MYKNIIFSVFGHDKRQLAIAKALAKMSFSVRLCCVNSFTDNISGCDVFLDWKQAVLGSDVLILPLPVSRDGTTLSCTDDKIYLEEVIRYASKYGCRYIVGGLIPKGMMMKDTENLQIRDYYDSEALQQKNALPTAEGALMLAMEHTDKIIKGMSVLINGYGRIGSLLADIMYKLGADVTVGSRRDESLCQATMAGYKVIRLTNDSNASALANQRFDVIFNTAPAQIFTKKVISSICGNPLYIEIASAPYGIDLVAARDAGMEVIIAPSIPSKYAPETAGMYILETVFDILKKGGLSI